MKDPEHRKTGEPASCRGPGLKSLVSPYPCARRGFIGLAVRIVNSVGAENIEVTGECCEARLAIPSGGISARMGSPSNDRGPARSEGHCR